MQSPRKRRELRITPQMIGAGFVLKKAVNLSSICSSGASAYSGVTISSLLRGKFDMWSYSQKPYLACVSSLFAAMRWTSFPLPSEALPRSNFYSYDVKCVAYIRRYERDDGRTIKKLGDRARTVTYEDLTNGEVVLALAVAEIEPPPDKVDLLDDIGCRHPTRFIAASRLISMHHSYS
jgi:hypothetical protein